MFKTPILFLIFNRLNTTKQVFEQIKKIRPTNLFMAADGPRSEKDGEKEKCDEVRNWVLSQIDWDCEVKTLFRTENLGCGKAVSQAITWFFEEVNEGIILEDDVLPNDSFFLFCETALERFRDETRVMHVSGNNFQLSKIGEGNYYLSKLPHIWGWATWKRAWSKYDFYLKDFGNDVKKSYYDYRPIDDYWHHIFYKTKEQLHTWDYQWSFSILESDGFCILPQYNLATNLGFGKDATHTSNIEDFLANLKTYDITFLSQEPKVEYNPIPDINFHKLFGWQFIEPSAKNITAREAISLLVNKFKAKMLMGIKW